MQKDPDVDGDPKVIARKIEDSRNLAWKGDERGDPIRASLRYRGRKGAEYPCSKLPVPLPLIA